MGRKVAGVIKTMNVKVSAPFSIPPVVYKYWSPSIMVDVVPMVPVPTPTIDWLPPSPTTVLGTVLENKPPPPTPVGPVAPLNPDTPTPVGPVAPSKPLQYTGAHSGFRCLQLMFIIEANIFFLTTSS
jgi:hypothetical protein